MKHFKVTVQYLNGIDFVFECEAENNWQAAAMARVHGRRMGFGGSMDVKNTIIEECLETFLKALFDEGLNPLVIREEF